VAFGDKDGPLLVGGIVARGKLAQRGIAEALEGAISSGPVHQRHLPR
jgi:hypothetical protein